MKQMSFKSTIFVFFIFLLWCILAPVISGCMSNTQNKTDEKQNTGSILLETIPAPSLAANKLGDPAEQPVLIYLPPSYDKSKQKRYPVIYFLQGFNEELDYYENGTYFNLKSEMDFLIQTGTVKEMIIIMPNGKNTLKGSFYWNSEVTGKWEDFIVNDVINYVDANWKTLAVRESRGIGGYSMGGFGALNIAMKHPEKFSVMSCLSGSIVDSEGIIQAIRTWDNYHISYVKKAYGAAVAPNTEKEYPYAEIPSFTGDLKDNQILDKWEQGMGTWETKIKKYRDNLQKYKAIRLEAGIYDEFRWIPAGNQYLSDLLLENGIRNEFNLFKGTHESHVSIQLKTSMLPFLSENLAN